MKLNIVVELDRAVKMVKPETGTLKLVITSTETFAALDEEGKQEKLKALEGETLFGNDKGGKLTFFGEDFAQYFTITTESETWDYNGGECNILETHYAAWAKRKGI